MLGWSNNPTVHPTFRCSMLGWSDGPTFHPTVHPTFDFMFDDVQCWGGQTVQHFIQQFIQHLILCLTMFNAGVVRRSNISSNSSSNIWFYVWRCSMLGWSDGPTFHPTVHPTFDFMFDDVQCWGGQTVQHFIQQFIQHLILCLTMFNAGVVRRSNISSNSSSNIWFYVWRCSMLGWSDGPTFHPTVHPTFDFMFDDVQCWGGQTVQHFNQHLSNIWFYVWWCSILGWSDGPTFQPTFHPTFDFMFDDVQCWGGQTIQHFTEQWRSANAGWDDGSFDQGITLRTKLS